MIPIRQTIVRRGTGYSRREWRLILKGAWALAGRAWVTNTLPKHFTEAGAIQYRYTPRHGKYTQSKRRVHGHQLPLVWSGTLRRQVTRRRDIRPFANRMRIVLHGPQYTTLRGGGGPDKARELTAVSDRDATQIARVMEQAIQNAVDSGRGARHIIYDGGAAGAA